MSSRPQTLYLIDGSAQFHRAYFAIRSLSTSKGLPTNATYGFTTMLRKLYQDEDPQWVGISFDVRAPTFRHEEYAAYKAHRPKMADELSVQVPFVRRVCEAFRLPILEAPGFEADDVIATLARQAVEKGFKVVVVSGDKDLLQLVSDDVLVLNPGREGAGSTLYDRKTVEEKFGVPPERVVDVLALVGDAVDNVPGVPGIGDKGARDLVREYGSLEEVLANAAKVKRAAYREGLEKHKEDAILSKRLVTLRYDVPVTLDEEGLRKREPDRSAAHALFTELEFAVLAREFAPEPAAMGTEHRLLQEDGELIEVVKEITRAGRTAVAILTSSHQPMRAVPRGLAFAWQPGRAVYVPLETAPLDRSRLDFGEGAAKPALDAAARDHRLEILRPLLEDPRVEKLGANVKHDRVVLAHHGLGYEGASFDLLIAAYLLDPGRRSYTLPELALEHLGQRPSTPGLDLTDPPSWEEAAQAAGEAADLVLRLDGILSPKLEAAGLTPVFREMELPLARVLADMERAGVKVDRELLAGMSGDMEKQLAALTREIHLLAKGEFNINSPVQLREVLFERLNLKSGKKTAKTRAASTAEDVLEELALTHELPRKILDYRAIQKLKSTYVDALPELIHPETGRIHASFNQAVAATGRISASDPNLQNIPIRTAEGRRIREAFVAETGHLLLSADYSQIELRILAHISKDQTLIDTFRRGEDIHDRTSREVFGPYSPLPPDEQRRRSKMINYALLYGKTAFTLAKDIGISKKEAETFIEAYFARYPSVKDFITRTIEEARASGVVRTLMGRLRRLPELKASNFQVRMEAERQAMNTPVQGSAADLIKKAMLDLDRELRRRSLHSRLILQIHDELVLEVPEREAEDTRDLVKRTMESAMALDVPLVVEAHLGKNWAEAH